MKNNKSIFSLILPLIIFFAQFSYAQLPDGFDIKKAYQQAQDKGISKSDVEGYVTFLHNDYLSHKGGHMQQDAGVYDAGTIF